ncbi:MAG: glycoside hydrolase 100 family protein [Anaerolineae bacterium]|nr:glycoside hydrolase 100 family protein [Anaerolineae bacterium]
MTELVDGGLIAEARERAEAILLANGSELGLLASSRAYRQVWARDSMIGGLGLLLCHDQEGTALHRRSLETLRRYQSPLGKIPHNVGVTNSADPALIAFAGLEQTDGEATVAEDTAHAGCVDGNLWYITGHYAHFAASRDVAFLQQAWQSLEKALLWLRYQDSNECGLLEVHEAMDWADLLTNRYNVLFDNVLYYAAWRSMGQMASALGKDGAAYEASAADVRRKLNTLLWVGPEEPKDWQWIARVRKEWLYPLRRVETELVERPFYLPYMAFRTYADRIDALGNLLAILFGVADQTKANKILDYLHGCGLNEPYPVRALYPPIQPGERDWRDYYRVRNLNLPHHYHNGGAWPFIGGFYVAALVQAGRLEEARYQLGKLAEMNRQGRAGAWEFNEWFHGLSGRPMGYAGQSWSAALYLFAHDAVAADQVSVLNDENGWKLA